jgi:beta-lactamase regulating signal transducer with metallopeptidase domain/uncharacterized GH25 family protein
MRSPWEILVELTSSGHAFRWLAGASLRITLVLAVAALLTLAMRRTSAAARHRVWALGLLSTILIPIAAASLPSYGVAVIESPQRVVATVPAEQFTTTTETGAVAPALRNTIVPDDAPQLAEERQPALQAEPPMLANGATWHGFELLVALWVAGALGSLSYVAIGVAAAGRLIARSRLMIDPQWLAIFSGLQDQTRVRRRVLLRETERSMSPVAWGWWRPQIILPKCCASWSPERRRSVLLHELAHVERGDWTWQMLTNILCALWWFHPLVWYAARELRRESEQAADNFVLDSGQGAGRYADDLLAIASELTRSRWLGPAQAMFHNTRLESRLVAILDRSRNRRRLTRRFALASLVVGVLAALAVATVTPTARQARAAADPAPTDNAPDKPDTSKDIDEIERFKASIASLKQIAWTAHERTEISRMPDKAACAHEKWMTAARDGEKWAALKKETGDILLDGKPLEYSTFREVVFNGDQTLLINPNHGGLQRKRFASPELVPLPTDSKSMQLIASGDGTSPVGNAAPFDFLHSGRIVFGHLNSYDFLPALLSGGKVDPNQKLAELPDCVAVTNVSHSGTCTAWLDSKHGFLPRRIDLRKTGNDKLGTSTINKVPAIKDPRIWPGSKLVEYRQLVDNVSIAELNGKPVIQKLTDTETHIYDDGQRLTFRNEFTIDELHSPGPDAFSPTIKIPDHTIVMMHMSRDSGYQWFGGKIVRDSEVAAKEQKKPRWMQIQVLSTDGNPIPGAEIHAGVWTEDPFQHNRDYRCDDQGQTTVELPPTLSILRLWANKTNFVGLFANWSEDQDNRRPILLPAEFIFRLDAGTFISGYVFDDDGKPIAGVKVEVELVLPPDADETQRPSLDNWLAYGTDARTTDERGWWILDNVPAGDNVEVAVRLSHPDYRSDYEWGGLQKEQKVTMKSLRDGTGKIVMHRGTSVTGTVTDEAGKPVPFAVVVWGDDPYLQLGSQEVRTDGDGRYKFPPLPDGPMNVTVVAHGWAPEIKKVAIGPKMSPVDFQLKPGKTLRIRFVDKAGAAIPEVFVGIHEWRGGKSLYNHKHPNVIDTTIPRQADANGVFEWTWAPDDPVTYDFYRKDYQSLTDQSFTAGDGEHQVTLLP